MKIGFDQNKYINEQSKFILERVNKCDKLYLEFGGKLLFDLHAKRVLPGFDENAKIKLLHSLKEKVEIIICVYSGDIERNKIRGDFGITYDMDVMRLIDDLREYNLLVNSVVITRYDDQPSTNIFINKLVNRNIKVYKHRSTKGYPNDIDTIVSEEGYGKNPYIETSRPIVVVTGPGPGSGKLATCLSQLYHESKLGRVPEYSKFETFPVWNLPLTHPVNTAYEAATVDLRDVNMIDPFHLEAYGEIAINYNRDIEAFPLLRRIIEKITGKESNYKSPTDMGVNRVKFGILDDNIVRYASEQEIIRRYFKTSCEVTKGYLDDETLALSKSILINNNLKIEDRKVVGSAREYMDKIRAEVSKCDIYSTLAIELPDGIIIRGRHSNIMDAPSATILNAIKYLANLDDAIHLISPTILEPILKLKSEIFKSKNSALNSEEILIALSISAATDSIASKALEQLSFLKNSQAHCTTILSKNDEQTFRKLGIDITSDPIFPTENLYYNE